MAEAEALETAVWGHVKGLLGDPEALLAQFQRHGPSRRRGRTRASGRRPGSWRPSSGGWSARRGG